MTHSGGVKSISDAELEAGIEMIRNMLAAREAGENAKVIETSPGDPGDTGEVQVSLRCAPGTRRKAERNVGRNVGTDSDSGNP